jgi:tRNA threonylcarbamoyladenosine biosynthesis protein TsaB
MITLALDASTYQGTVAVLHGHRLLASRRATMRGRETEALMPAVMAAMADAGIEPQDLAQVVCGAGPGSFTSLRIAAGIAKGLAHGRSIPLLAVSSLTLLAAASVHQPATCMAVLDALRGEWYASVLQRDALGQWIELHPAATVPDADVEGRAAALGCDIVGGRWQPAAPDAAAVATLMEHDPSQHLVPVDLGSWEPRYGRLAEAQVKWEAAHGRALG